jgi:hypothetical protein
MAPPDLVLRRNWSNPEFHALVSSPPYVAMVDSWREQRLWGIDAPLAALRDHGLAAEIKAAFVKQQAYMPDVTGYQHVTPAQLNTMEFSNDHIAIAFSGADGSIRSLRQLSSNASFVGAGGALGQLTYQTYSQEQYTQFMLDYNYLG